MADSLAILSSTLSKIISPIIISLGVIGNTFNIIILTRPALQHHPCSRYFLALVCNDLFYSIFLIYSYLNNAYQIYPQNSSLFWCKFFFTVSAFLPFLSAYFIVLASFDRFCASSTNARLRNWSNPKVARLAILIVILFWCLFHINTAILCELSFADYLGCGVRMNTLYTKIYFVIETLSFEIVAPCLMILFGILTILNTKHVRLLPTVKASYRRTEGQLIRMLLIQVATYVVFTFPLSIMYLMLVLPIGFHPSSSFMFVLSIANFLYAFSYVLPIFLFILSSRVYREVFFRLIYKILRIKYDTRIQPTMTANGFHETAIYLRTMTVIQK